MPPEPIRSSKRPPPAGIARSGKKQRTSVANALPPIEVDKVILLQGPELLALMKEEGPDRKMVDNQKLLMEPGWYPVKIGKDKNWRQQAWAADEPLGPLVKNVPHNPDLEHWHGHVPMMLYYGPGREPDECNGHAWAAGPKCYPIMAYKMLEHPVPIKHKGQALKWSLPAEELKQIEDQLGDPREFTILDTSALG